MNERIQQLAEQCYETGPIGKDGWPEYSKFNESKFAELIVKECAKFLEENSGYDECNNAWHPEPEDLLQHFGVEE